MELDSQPDWPQNVWIGVSVENSDYTFRIDDLRPTHAKIKFLSLEPLLGPLHHFNLKGIDWVIVGGESGRHAVRNNLSKFVAKVELGYNTAKIWYTFPLEGPLHLIKGERFGGTLYIYSNHVEIEEAATRDQRRRQLRSVYAAGM